LTLTIIDVNEYHDSKYVRFSSSAQPETSDHRRLLNLSMRKPHEST
jgi:hypothetical protein